MALRLKPTYAEANNNLGYALYSRGDLDGAIATWNDLLGRNPRSNIQSQTLYWIGKTFAARGDDASANRTSIIILLNLLLPSPRSLTTPLFPP